jgi:hypothetical protein
MSNMADFFDRLATLRREGQSFAVATVVARRSPVSAHLGDRACGPHCRMQFIDAPDRYLARHAL